MAYDKQIISAYRKIYNKTGAGNDFLGWVDLPSEISDDFLDQINAHAKALQAKSEVFVVVGIGGSYLGARAMIEALHSTFGHLKNNGLPQIIYAGHQLSEDYLSELLELLNHKEYSMAVISKSGTTTEPAVAFRMLRTHIEQNMAWKKPATHRSHYRQIAWRTQAAGRQRRLYQLCGSG